MKRIFLVVDLRRDPLSNELDLGNYGLSHLYATAQEAHIDGEKREISPGYERFVVELKPMAKTVMSPQTAAVESFV